MGWREGGGRARGHEAEGGPPGLPQLAVPSTAASLSVLLVFVSAFRAVVRVTVGVVVEVHFVHGLDGLGQIVLQGRDGRAQRRSAEAV